MSITEFITARLDEIAEVAQAADDDPAGYDCWFDTGNEHISGHYLNHDPAYVLADVAAKRRMVENSVFVTERQFAGGMYEDYVRETLHLLALPFASHPDYRPEYAPFGEKRRPHPM